MNRWLRFFQPAGKAGASDKCLGNWLKGGRLGPKTAAEKPRGTCSWTEVPAAPCPRGWPRVLAWRNGVNSCSPRNHPIVKIVRLPTSVILTLCLPCCPAQEMKALPRSQGFVSWRSIPSKLQIMNSFSSEAWLANIGWPQAPPFCAPNLSWIRRLLNGRYIITLKGECHSSRSQCCKVRASTIICLCCYNWSRGCNKREVNKLNWVSLWCILLRRGGNKYYPSVEVKKKNFTFKLHSVL